MPIKEQKEDMPVQNLNNDLQPGLPSLQERGPRGEVGKVILAGAGPGDAGPDHR